MTLMKYAIVFMAVLSLSACGPRGAPTETSTPLAFYTFSEGDAYKYAAEGRACWAESNRANWNLC